VTLFIPEWMWLDSLIALILKYAFSRALGPRRTEELIVPAASGFAIGYGFLVLVADLYVWITYSWPFLLTNWKP